MRRTVVAGVFLLGALTGCDAVLLDAAPDEAAAQGLFSGLSSGMAPVWRQIRQVRNRGEVPLVAVRIDGTLNDTRPRTRKILMEWGETSDGAPYGKQLNWYCRSETAGKDLPNSMVAAGVPRRLWSDANNFWHRRFEDAAYLQYDKPLPGAQAFVRALSQAGAKVVFISGRPQSLQTATEKQLREFGLVTGPERPLIAYGFAENNYTDYDPTDEPICPSPCKRAFTPQIASTLRQVEKAGPLVALVDDSPMAVRVWEEALPGVKMVLFEWDFDRQSYRMSPKVIRIRELPPQ